jgi:hypothetical protein
MLVDCGSALHHAVVALRGQGARVRVDRCPDPLWPDLLASVSVDGLGAPTPAEVRAHRAIALRPVSIAVEVRPDDAAVPAAALALMESAAAQAGARLRPCAAGPDDPAGAAAVIEADIDSPQGWLRAGEALSAVALTVAECGLVVLPGPGLVAGARGWLAVPLRLAAADRRTATRLAGERAS